MGYSHKYKLFSSDKATSVRRGDTIARTISELGPGANDGSQTLVQTPATTEDIYPEGLASRSRRPNFIVDDDDEGSLDEDASEVNTNHHLRESATRSRNLVSDEDDEGSFDEDTLEVNTNHLTWPCPSCIPGNDTRYTCPNPIPNPTPDMIANASLAYPHMPTRGIPRASLAYSSRCIIFSRYDINTHLPFLGLQSWR